MVTEVRTGQDTAKKKAHSHIERGRRCVGWYGLRDGEDMEQWDWLGPGKKCKPAQDARVLRQVWVRGKKMLVTCSNLVKGVQDWSGHQKKRGGEGHSLAHVLVICTVRGGGKRMQWP